MTLASLFVILNLVLLESLLSIDNAAVLAVMVNEKLDNPADRKKAMTYGIWGAYILRGICLLFASFLFKVIWLKIVGGLYLLKLTYEHFTPAKDSPEEGIDETSTGYMGWFYKKVNSLGTKIGPLWTTIILVEVMDLAFSLDNIFAAVALTKNLYLILAGVFIGILAMRFVAQKFTVLMEKYPSLERSAFVVIGLLGLKLIVSGVLNYFPGTTFGEVLESHTTDLLFSLATLVVFLTPIIFGRKK